MIMLNVHCETICLNIDLISLIHYKISDNVTLSCERFVSNKSTKVEEKKETRLSLNRQVDFHLRRRRSFFTNVSFTETSVHGSEGGGGGLDSILAQNKFSI